MLINAQSDEILSGDKNPTITGPRLDVAASLTDHQRLKLRLKGSYLNFYEDSAGRIYALCCYYHGCNANTSSKGAKDPEIKYPNMDAEKLRSHMASSHKVTGRTIAWVIEKCKGEEIPSNDLWRIGHGQPTKHDTRIKVYSGSGVKVVEGDDDSMLQTCHTCMIVTNNITPGTSDPGSVHPGGPKGTNALDRAAHPHTVYRARKSGLFGSGPTPASSLDQPTFDQSSLATQETSGNRAESGADVANQARGTFHDPTSQPQGIQGKLADAGDVQGMFQILKEQRFYLNLHQDVDGSIYALCCHHADCGANTARDHISTATAPTFTPARLRQHLRQTHDEEGEEEDAVQKCKGLPISAEDIRLIYHEQVSSVHDRVTMKSVARKRALPRNSIGGKSGFHTEF